MEKLPSQPTKTTEKNEIPYAYMRKETIVAKDFACDFLRVQHTRETIEQYAKELEDFIAQSDVLVTEVAVPEEKEDASSIEYFYHQIYLMAERSRVLMTVPDPEKNVAQAAVNRFSDLVPAGLATTAVVYLAKKLKEISEQKWAASINTGDGPARYPRREFFKMGGAAAVAGMGGLTFFAGAMKELGIEPEKGGVLEQFLVNSIDYRDACIAKEIMQRGKESKKVSVIYGAKHYHGVKKYLEDPELLGRNLKKYEAIYGVWNPAQTEEFDFRAAKKQTYEKRVGEHR